MCNRVKKKGGPGPGGIIMACCDCHQQQMPGASQPTVVFLWLGAGRADATPSWRRRTRRRHGSSMFGYEYSGAGRPSPVVHMLYSSAGLPEPRNLGRRRSTGIAACQRQREWQCRDDSMHSLQCTGNVRFKQAGLGRQCWIRRALVSEGPTAPSEVVRLSITTQR
jgi:hypothetical protein